MQFYPGKRFEQNNGVCPVYTVTVNPLAVAANTLIITGVTNKKISIVGGCAHSTGVATTLSLRTGSSGTAIRYIILPANTVANPNIPLVATPGDVLEMNTGEGLYIDNGAAVVLLTINYILYTP